jgi:DNA polymerase-4
MLTKFPHIMLVDMNSFFASVEQQVNPFLRNRPLAVSASGHKTSCLIATSKEAKALGIQTGTSAQEARKIYPKIQIVRADPEKYREVNRKINKIFCDYTDVVEPYSIDESFLDLTRSKINRLIVGAEIKRRIRDEVGEWLTCSIGIAPNKFMAKLASDMEKPDGLTVIWRESLPEVYKDKKLSDLWGIGRGWTKRLDKIGIKTPLGLMNYPVGNLLQLFGKPGFHLWQRVNGLEIDEVLGDSLNNPDQKSFGNSWVLSFRTTDKERLKPVVMRLAEKAARRMRHEGFKASNIYVSLRFSDRTYFHRSLRLKYQINTGRALYEEVLKMWQTISFRSPVVHVAVGFSRLCPDVSQLSFWPDDEDNLTPALDKLNDKYGEFMVSSGLLAKTSAFAPDSIAFGK